MTICVSVRVAEGLVLAADSATILQGDIVGPDGTTQRQLLQTFNYATKVAQVGGFPMGVMTWGLGSIASRSIQSLVMEFEFQYEPRPPFVVETVANDLLTFIMARYDAAIPTPTPMHTLGLFVGGYSDGEFFSSQFSVELPAQRAWTKVRPDTAPNVPDFGSNWFGASDALQRLILGFDPPALEKLVARGVDRGLVQAWLDAHEASLPIIFDGMPLQDAIDFAEWATAVVIGRWRFGMGAQLVGGDVDVAVIRPRSFQWAQRKRWSIKDDGTRRTSAATDDRLGRYSEDGVPSDWDPGKRDGVSGELPAAPVPRRQHTGPGRGNAPKRSTRRH